MSTELPPNVKRQRELEPRIGCAFAAGSIPDGSTITIALDEGALAIRDVNVQ